MSDPVIYTHPDIRKQDIEAYQTHLQFLRSERVLISQEFVAKEKQKIVSKGNKASERFNKLSTRIDNRISKIREMIELTHKEIETLTLLDAEIQASEKALNNDD